MATHKNLAIRMGADPAAPRTVAGTRTRARIRLYARRALARIAVPILIVSTCLLFGTAARAQDGGYMRALTSHGQVAGESTDPKFNGWILLHGATMPSAPEIAAMADESGAGSATGGAKAVRKPVIIVKDRDQSSLALLGAYTSHQPVSYTHLDVYKRQLVYGLNDTLLLDVTDAQWRTMDVYFTKRRVDRTARSLHLDISTASRSLKRGSYWQLAEVAGTMKAILKDEWS